MIGTLSITPKDHCCDLVMSETKLTSATLKATESFLGDDYRSRSVQFICVLGTVASSAFLMLWSGPGIFQLVVGLYLLVLIYIGVRDVKERTISNRVVIPATLAAVALAPLGIHQQEYGLLPSMGLSALGWLFCIIWMGLAAYLSRGRLAGGDIKLAGLVGAITAMPVAPAALGAGIIISGVYALVMVGPGSRKVFEEMPYGLGLSAGGCALVLYVWLNGMF